MQILFTLKVFCTHPKLLHCLCKYFRHLFTFILCMLLNRSHGTLMSYTDQSDDPLQIHVAKGSTRQMVHPNHSKCALRNEMPLCVARRWTILLCLYIYIYIHIYMSRIRSVAFRPIATPFHYIDFHTTQTVSRYLGLHFPCVISLITSSPAANYTHYIAPTQILLKSLSIVITTPAIARLQSL